MAKGKKRKPDLRRIRTSKTYTLPEIAKTLDRDIATVRTWVRKSLPLLSKQKPVLVLGSDLKAWLRVRWKVKRQKCQLGELFCCKCWMPRKLKPGTAKITPRNENNVWVKGKCIICETRMNQIRSLNDLDELEKAIQRAIAA